MFPFSVDRWSTLVFFSGGGVERGGGRGRSVHAVYGNERRCFRKLRPKQKRRKRRRKKKLKKKTKKKPGAVFAHRRVMVVPDVKLRGSGRRCWLARRLANTHTLTHTHTHTHTHRYIHLETHTHTHISGLKNETTEGRSVGIVGPDPDGRMGGGRTVEGGPGRTVAGR